MTDLKGREEHNKKSFTHSTLLIHCDTLQRLVCFSCWMKAATCCNGPPTPIMKRWKPQPARSKALKEPLGVEHTFRKIAACPRCRKHNESYDCQAWWGGSGSATSFIRGRTMAPCTEAKLFWLCVYLLSCLLWCDTDPGWGRIVVWKKFCLDLCLCVKPEDQKRRWGEAWRLRGELREALPLCWRTRLKTEGQETVGECSDFKGTEDEREPKAPRTVRAGPESERGKSRAEGPRSQGLGKWTRAEGHNQSKGVNARRLKPRKWFKAWRAKCCTEGQRSNLSRPSWAWGELGLEEYPELNDSRGPPPHFILTSRHGRRDSTWQEWAPERSGWASKAGTRQPLTGWHGYPQGLTC